MGAVKILSGFPPAPLGPNEPPGSPGSKGEISPCQGGESASNLSRQFGLGARPGFRIRLETGRSCRVGGP